MERNELLEKLTLLRYLDQRQEGNLPEESSIFRAIGVEPTLTLPSSGQSGSNACSRGRATTWTRAGEPGEPAGVADSVLFVTRP